MKLNNKIKEKIRTGLTYLTIVSVPLIGLTALTALTDHRNYVRGYDQGYEIIQSQGLKEGSTKIVESIKDTYKYAEPWRIIAHYYDPYIVRNVKFSDGTEATLEYSVFSNASVFKRKIFGPEKGDKCVMIKHSLKLER